MPYICGAEASTSGEEVFVDVRAKAKPERTPEAMPGPTLYLFKAVLRGPYTHLRPCFGVPILL